MAQENKSSSKNNEIKENRHFRFDLRQFTAFLVSVLKAEDSKLKIFDTFFFLHRYQNHSA